VVPRPGCKNKKKRRARGTVGGEVRATASGAQQRQREGAVLLCSQSCTRGDEATTAPVHVKNHRTPPTPRSRPEARGGSRSCGRRRPPSLPPRAPPRTLPRAGSRSPRAALAGTCRHGSEGYDDTRLPRVFFFPREVQSVKRTQTNIQHHGGSVLQANFAGWCWERRASQWRLHRLEDTHVSSSMEERHPSSMPVVTSRS